MDVLAGSASSIRVDFETETGLVVADTGSTSFKLFDQTGTLLATLSATPNGDTGATVALPSTYHTIGTGKAFARRSVLAQWTAGGQAFQHWINYRVVPFALYTATPDDVRSALGLGVDELADREIDLFAAYLSVAADVTSVILDAALSSGTVVETAANAAIVADCAITLLPSLQTRTAMALTDGDQKFERFRTPPDWKALENELRSTRSAAVAQFAEGGGNIAQTLTTFTSPTDAITG